MSHPGVITVLTLTVSVLLPLDSHLVPSAVLGEDPVSVTQSVLDAVWPPAAVMSVIPMMIGCPPVYVTPLVMSPLMMMMSPLPVPGLRSVAMVIVTVMWSVRSAPIEIEPLVHLIIF